MERYGVLIHRPDSPYDDRPADRYQFPRQYLSRAKRLEGCWILYYAPTKARSLQGYFAAARICEIIHDERRQDMFVALIEPQTYFEFPKPIPFSDQNGWVERGILNEHGRVSGRAQAAIRPISPQDFSRILDRALPADILHVDRSESASGGFAEPQAFFETARERTGFLLSRAVRDRAFRRLVLDAYDQRCAVTGWRWTGEDEQVETIACHIRPVSKNGPDSLTNGIALSATIHWMFDHGLFTFSDDYRMLVSSRANDPDSTRAMINPTGRLFLPTKPEARPHPRYLAWHREHCFLR